MPSGNTGIVFNREIYTVYTIYGKDYGTCMKKPSSLKFAVFVLALACAAPSYASPRMAFIDSLMRNFRVEPCCATSLNQCALQKPNCDIAIRLINFLMWMDSTGQIPNERMAELLHNRYSTFADTKTHTYNLAGWPVIGDRNAPVTVVMYFSGTCPMCKFAFRELNGELTAGKLKGKVKMVVKPAFGAIPVNRAIMLAHDMGRFTDYMLALSRAEGRIDEEILLSIADGLLFDRQAFKSRMEDPKLIERIEASGKEAQINGVTHVPSYFISGRRYNSVMDIRWIIDAMEFMDQAQMKR